MKGVFLLILLTFFVLFNSGILKAQPTLTSANIGYTIGDVFIIGANNAGFNFFIQPQIGANQVWNFSSSLAPGFDTIRVLSRTQAPVVSGIPAANLVIYSNNDNHNNGADYRYLETNHTKTTEQRKVINGNPYPRFYVKSPEVFRFPMSYNVSYSDTAVSTYSNANNVTCTYKEIYTIEAVGYGQLISPVATYNQALQVRTTRESLSDNCRPQMHKGFYSDVYYTWYVPGIHMPVFQIAEHTASLGYYYSGYYLQVSQLGNKEDLPAQLSFKIFPNPATSEVTIQYALKSASNVSLTVFDALGREVIQKVQEKQPAGNISENLDISKLSKGVYLLRLEMQEGVVVKQLLIQ